MSVVHSNQDEFVAGNYFDKYRSSNPIHQHLMKRFLQTAVELIRDLNCKTVLEAGCGPGDLASRLLPAAGYQGCSYIGTDLSRDEVEKARRSHPAMRFEIAPIEQLPVADDSQELVIACEVLEHVEDPSKAIAEIARVNSSWALISVPREPLWRFLNVLRGRYLGSLGNTPGHLQHFNQRKLVALVDPFYEVQRVELPLPWIMMLLRRREQD